MAENISNTGASGSSAATSQAQAPQTAQTAQSEVIKTRKKRSHVWDYFTIVVDDKGNREVVCVCGKKFGYSGSGTTSSMKTHVNEKCPNNPLRFGRSQQKLAFQSSPGGGKGDIFPVPWKFDQEECRMALCRMVIVDELSFSFVEKEGFRNFMKVAQPSFRIPSRTTVTRDCYALFNVEKKKLMKFFNEQKVSSSVTMETSSLGLGDFLEEIRRHKATSGGADSKSELEKYLAEELENERPGFDILNWWKVNSPRFPVLAKMARDVLAIPISSVASESAFSTGGRILDPFRSSLTPKLVETLVCLQDWLRCESLPVSVEEDIEFLETLEEDFANLGFEASTDAE